jgi:hypothetical protein
LDDLLHVKLTGRLPERMDEIQYVKNLLKSRQPASRTEVPDNELPPVP